MTNTINKLQTAPVRMTVAAEYASLALLAIGECDPAWCKRAEITERFTIPTPFLEQILRKLVAAGFVISRRGAGGGFRLARPAREIVIADVVRALDGPLAPTRSVSRNFYQPTPVEASTAFHGLFLRVRDAIAEILEAATLEEMLEQERIARRRGRKVTRPAARRPGSTARSRRDARSR